MDGSSDAYFDVSGRTLRRRINCTIFWIFVCAALLVGVLVLQIIGNQADSEIEDQLGIASEQFAKVQALVNGNPSVSAAVASQNFFRCPTGITIPRKRVVLGSDYAHGIGADVGLTWYQQMVQFAGPSRADIIVPVGITLDEQLTALQNDSKFAQWTISNEPLLVFFELGYVESLASLAVQLGEVSSDSRTLDPVSLIRADSILLRASWWHSAQNLIVFLVPTLPYSPSLGGFVQTHCTDPLAESLFNIPASFLTMKAVSEIPNAIASTHIITTLASQISATVRVLTTDSLFASFSFNTASNVDNLAFAPDCLSLNNAGQRLLARYLWSCVQGLDFTVPSSLLDVKKK